MAAPSNMARASIGSVLLPALAQNWWVFLVRGLVAIVFGLVALAWPGATLVTLVLFYGVFALIDGVFAVIAAVRGKGAKGSRWWLSFVGLLGIVAGLVTYFSPGLTALALLVVIGIWALMYGVVEIVGAIRLRKEIDNEWMLIIHGALAAAFGVLVLVRPGAGALALIWLIGSFAILSGVLLIAFALALKKRARAD